MDQEQLRERLEHLQAELQQVRAVDDDSRKALAHLVADVQALLDGTGEDAPPRDLPLADRLQEGIQQFQGTHPTLTLAMERVLDTLSQTGI